MNKLMASFACTAVLSMSLMGVGYASDASATVGEESVAIHGTNDMYRGDGTNYPTGVGTLRTNDNTVTPLVNTTRTGAYRTTAVNNNRNNFSWGWLGLIGLFGLAGMRNRNREHR